VYTTADLGCTPLLMVYTTWGVHHNPHFLLPASTLRWATRSNSGLPVKSFGSGSPLTRAARIRSRGFSTLQTCITSELAHLLLTLFHPSPSILCPSGLAPAPLATRLPTRSWEPPPRAALASIARASML